MFESKDNLKSKIELSSTEMSLVQEVLMREGVISSARSEKPILATYGVGPCIAFVGYCKELKRGFVTYLDGAVDFELGGTGEKYWFPRSLNVISDFGAVGFGIVANYDVRLLQGSTDSDLLRGVEQYIENMNEGNRIHFNVVERDVNHSFQGGKNIALDLRDGKTYSYDPCKNPKTRGTSEFLEAIMLAPKKLTSLRWTIDESVKR